jgi:ketosteroid isomerase-like protein
MQRKEIINTRRCSGTGSHHLITAIDHDLFQREKKNKQSPEFNQISMKQGLLILIILFTVTSSSLAQEKFSESETEVQQIIRQMFDALSTRDSISLKNYCTPDIALFEHGQVWNLDSLIRKGIRENTASDFKRVNTFDFIDTSIEGNTAWATYNLRSDILRGGKEGTIYWLETVVLVKQNRRWKLKVLHSTRIKRT